MPKSSTSPKAAGTVTPTMKKPMAISTKASASNTLPTSRQAVRAGGQPAALAPVSGGGRRAQRLDHWNSE